MSNGNTNTGYFILTHDFMDNKLRVIGPMAAIVYCVILMFESEGRTAELTQSAIAKTVNLSRATVFRSLRVLAQHGLLDAQQWPDVGDYAARLNQEEWDAIRKTVFQRDNYTCTYCGQRGGKLECDHIIPIAKGGSNHPENLTTACLKCNRSKGKKMLEQWSK